MTTLSNEKRAQTMGKVVRIIKEWYHDFTSFHIALKIKCNDL